MSVSQHSRPPGVYITNHFSFLFIYLFTIENFLLFQFKIAIEENAFSEYL